jgi:dTDP-4-amino-4,6-dideoxygalactose transaminase
MHMQPVFAGAPAYVGNVSESLFKQGLCLPSGSSLLPEQLDYIAGLIKALW